ncbi:MAG: cytochrome P450 [Longispora sp.]|nr:cytochrome P450 [Longispora sp. (in: high G+C Gram-positive bacteria)]
MPEPTIDQRNSFKISGCSTGWLGSRVARHDTDVAGVFIKAGTMVFYSPYLTHRDPQLWTDPTEFRPERFDHGRPAWGFIPFAAGRRTCLGAHLARAMLRTALEGLIENRLTQVHGETNIRAGITLSPAGPLVVHRNAGVQRTTNY